MRDDLAGALEKKELEAPSTFAHVFFVDDFAGSGETMLRRDGESFKGKLVKLQVALRSLEEAGLLAEDCVRSRSSSMSPPNRRANRSKDCWRRARSLSRRSGSLRSFLPRFVSSSQIRPSRHSPSATTTRR